MAVLDALEREDGFTDVEVNLARYICAHADEVCRMGIADLAKVSYTSNATIVRLCRKVGVKGFRDLRVELASDLEKKRTERADVDPDRPFGAGEQVEDVIANVSSLMKSSIDTCYAAIKPGEVERVARAICKASQVYIYAIGDSRISAMAFANQLMKLGIRAMVANQYGDGSAAAHGVRSGDVVIIVSYSGYLLDDMRSFLPLFKERRCKTVLVSAAKAPMGIDYSFRIPAKEGGIGKIATFYSQTCIRLVLNCIYGEVFELDYEVNQARKDAGERDNTNLTIR